MRFHTRLHFLALCLLAFSAAVVASPGVADAAASETAATEVSMGIETQLSLDVGAPALAAVVGSGERKLYVLTRGAIVTYELPAGTALGRFEVDPSFDGLERFPFSDTLVLSSSESGRVELIQPFVLADFDNEGRPYFGAEEAPVTVTLFAEYQCPNCAKFGPIYMDVLQRFSGRVRVVFRYYPLDKHPQAVPAARAALAAHELGAFAPYHKALYANQESLSQELYLRLAKEFGLDPDQFLKVFNSPEVAAMVREDIEAATAAGVFKVPTIFVNGKLLTDWSQDGFYALIQEQLRAAAAEQAHE